MVEMTVLQKLHQDIVQLSDLSPSPKVNRLFGELVVAAINPDSTLNLTPAQIKDLQHKASSAEVALERHWIKRIIAAEDPQAELEQFPYMNNYQQLTAMELELIRLQNSGKQDERPITFVGGGLPLTSYVLAKEHGIRSVILDNDPEAADLAQELIRKIGMQDRMEVICSGGELFTGYGSLTVVAALAGVDDQIKMNILAQIAKSSPSGSHILARTIETGTPREVLYPPLPPQVYAEHKTLQLVHPGRTQNYQQVINSVAYLETTPHAA